MARKNVPGTVYLLHFSTNLHHAKHYMGFAEGNEDGLARRLEEHRRGQGARLTEVIAELGITFELARTWDGTRNVERKLKNQKRAPKLCPICAGEAALRQAVDPAGKKKKTTKKKTAKVVSFQATMQLTAAAD